MNRKPLARAVLTVFAGAALLGAGYFAGTRHAATGTAVASTGAASPGGPTTITISPLGGASA